MRPGARALDRGQSHPCRLTREYICNPKKMELVYTLWGIGVAHPSGSVFPSVMELNTQLKSHLRVKQLKCKPFQSIIMKAVQLWLVTVRKLLFNDHKNIIQMGIEQF
jgi:hypothetical protein